MRGQLLPTTAAYIKLYTALTSVSTQHTYVYVNNINKGDITSRR